VNINTEIAAYLRYCEYQKKLNTKTIKAYSIDLKQFNRYVNLMPGQNITKPVVSEYIINLHQAYRPQTVKRKLASLRAFLNHLEYEEIININPINKIKTKFQEPKILPRTIPIKAIEQILSIARREKELAKTDYGVFTAIREIAILEMLFATGMRISELCSLKSDDVNLEEGIIRIMGKGAKERVIQIGNEEVLLCLNDYWSLNKNKLNFFLLTG
jgi:integrase/recombinase XerD